MKSIFPERLHYIPRQNTEGPPLSGADWLTEPAHAAQLRLLGHSIPIDVDDYEKFDSWWYIDRMNGPVSVKLMRTKGKVPAVRCSTFQWSCCS